MSSDGPDTFTKGVKLAWLLLGAVGAYSAYKAGTGVAELGEAAQSYRDAGRRGHRQSRRPGAGPHLPPVCGIGSRAAAKQVGCCVWAAVATAARRRRAAAPLPQPAGTLVGCHKNACLPVCLQRGDHEGPC